MHNSFAPIAVIELDKNDHLLYANKRAQTLFDIPAAAVNQPFYPKKNSLFFKKPTQILSFDGEPYLVEKINCVDKICLMLQPISYLQQQLSYYPTNKQVAFDNLITQSKAMQALLEKAKAFAKQNDPLLISGETGSGKDVLALACHHYSTRSKNTFLALNCGGLPDEMAESELFGYADGVYGGTTKEKKGFFEQAHGGTVFLDGIDEMSPNLQRKLIRFIAEGTFRRIGNDNEVKVDIRIICATQSNLYSLVEKGEFRQDLYYRLNVLPLVVPPLRERKPDILPLTEFFIKTFANKQGIEAPRIDNKLMSMLIDYCWPGNVRQLKNVLYSALAQHKGERLLPADIHLPSKVSLGDDIVALTKKMENKTLDDMVKQFEKSVLVSLYAEYPSSRKLSKRLGLSHTAIANKLREYGIGK